MSIKRISAVWDQSRAKGTTLLVLLAIADNASDNGLAWPGLETIAQRARVGKRAVIAHLRKLEDLDELVIFRRPGQHNYYLIKVGLTEDQHRAALEELHKRPGIRHDPEEVVIKRSPVQNSGVVIKRSPGGDQMITSTGDRAITRSINRTVNEPSLGPADAPDGGQQGAQPVSRQPERPEPVPTPEPEPAQKPRPVQAHVAIIDAYRDALHDAGFDPLIDNWYSRFGRAAKTFVAHGISPERVRAATLAVYGPHFEDSFYRHRAKPITLDELREVFAAAEAAAEKARPVVVDYGTRTQQDVWSEIVAEHLRDLASGRYDALLTPEERAEQAQKGRTA